MRRSTAICSCIAAVVIGSTLLLPVVHAQIAAPDEHTLADGVFIAHGDFDVLVSVEGEKNARTMSRVTEVSLLRDWAVLQRVESGKNVTLVIPRDALITMEMID